MASKSSGILQRNIREVRTNRPSTVSRANVSEARKKQMEIAIAYEKSRRQGAHLPKK